MGVLPLQHRNSIEIAVHHIQEETMNVMFAYLSSWILGTRTSLRLCDFKEKRYSSSPRNWDISDNWTKDELESFFANNKPGGVLAEYYNDQGARVGYIKYYLSTGQVGLFFIEDAYQRRGLGKQILSKVIEELKANHCEEVWAVTTNDHPFWSNVYDWSFTHRCPAHPSVTGGGYFMKLQP